MLWQVGCATFSKNPCCSYPKDSLLWDYLAWSISGEECRLKADRKKDVMYANKTSLCMKSVDCCDVTSGGRRF